MCAHTVSLARRDLAAKLTAQRTNSCGFADVASVARAEGVGPRGEGPMPLVPAASAVLA